MRSFWARLLDPTRVAVRLVESQTRAAGRAIEDQVMPAWRRVTESEPRLPAVLAVLVAIGLHLALPERIGGHPRWLFPTIAGLMLVSLMVGNPNRTDRSTPGLRAGLLLLVVVMSGANMAAGARLVVDLVEGEGVREPADLLLTGGAIWLVNVIVFALWYWLLDRGGSAARALGVNPYPDFLFPQMTAPELSPPGWEPGFVDYLYTSFTNATAFSPTDVMPMSRWAKMAMLAQSALSLALAALVIARAVNVLE